MKRFAILFLPLCVAIAPVGSAQDDADEPRIVQPPQQRAARAPRPAPQQPQAQAPRNLPAVQRPQTFRGLPPVQRVRPTGDSDVSISPRMRHRAYPQIERNPVEPPVFTPPQPPGIPQPVPVAQTQPIPQPAVVEGRNRDWTGRGGNRGDGATNPGGTVGNENWRTRRGGGDGNNDWRTRRGNGDGNNDWRGRRGDGDGNHWGNNDNDGERRRRRGSWRHDEDRRREWTESRLHRRNEWSRHRRNRSWWTSRYNRFALFGGGYYYWNSGYWYPAYGYDPYFSTYTYDAPIYSYNDQDPGDVIANVQQALQQQGYYQGELDGSFGPLTRQALLAYQRDNGLPVTGEIDQDTLGALGFE